ncbi:MAG: hypothetical protein V1492_02875 [Candidatus Micrarchaeota archaeon]
MKKELFENCKVQYAYDGKQKIYSMLIYFNKRPRILTIRVGSDFLEASLANSKGEVLEVLSQEKGEMKFIKKR